MSYKPQEIHILKIITMVEVEIDVENTKIKILRSCMEIFHQGIYKSKDLDDFNMMMQVRNH
jgi:hypothetical protein